MDFFQIVDTGKWADAATVVRLKLDAAKAPRLSAMCHVAAALETQEGENVTVSRHSLTIVSLMAIAGHAAMLEGTV
jgi:DNA-directed RNA polymerase subunit H (RpoH/RPB5)